MTDRETPNYSVLTPEPTAVKFRLKNSTFANQRARDKGNIDIALSFDSREIESETNRKVLFQPFLNERDHMGRLISNEYSTSTPHKYRFTSK